MAFGKFFLRDTAGSSVRIANHSARFGSSLPAREASHIINQFLDPIEYRSDDVTKINFLKLWDMMSYSYRGS